MRGKFAAAEDVLHFFAGYNGPPSEGERVLAPLKKLGTPVVDAIGPIPYCQLNTLFDASLAPGLRNYWKSSFFAELSDEAIPVSASPRWLQLRVRLTVDRPG